MPREGRPRFLKLVSHQQTDGFPVVSLPSGLTRWWVSLPIIAGSCLLGLGCKSDSTWAPTLPKFGESNLVFGSRTNPSDAIEPPAMSFRPGEGTRAPGSTGSPAAADATRMAGSNTAPSGLSRAPYAYDPQPNRENTPDPLANSARSVAGGGLAGPGPGNSLAGPTTGNPSGGLGVNPNSGAAPANATDLDRSLAQFNQSVTNSPLLPAGPGSDQGRDIRGIPGGSLGNPLAALPAPGGLPSPGSLASSGSRPPNSMMNSTAGGPPAGSALPPLPSAPDSRQGLGSEQSAGLNPPTGNLSRGGESAFAAAGLTQPSPSGGLPSIGSSLPPIGGSPPLTGSLPNPGTRLPALGGLPSPPAPPANDAALMAAGTATSPGRNLATPGTGLPPLGALPPANFGNAASNPATLPATPESALAAGGSGFRPGSVSGSPIGAIAGSESRMAPAGATTPEPPRYPQTQHGQFPGLPAWPDSGTRPSPAPPAPALAPGQIPSPSLTPASGLTPSSGQSLPAAPSSAPTGVFPGGATPSGLPPAGSTLPPPTSGSPLPARPVLPNFPVGSRLSPATLGEALPNTILAQRLEPIRENTSAAAVDCRDGQCVIRFD